MFSRLFNQNKRTVDSDLFLEMPMHPKDGFSLLSYNWILSHRLAIGPMPKTASHWKQLEDEGFRNRFSCCYPHEHIFTPIPETWNTREISLPDHRQQSRLDKTRLILALNQAEDMLINYSGPLYLHCFAGQERSALIAIGLVSIVEKKDLFDSIYLVKQCHKEAKPLYDQLSMLESVLNEDFN